MNENLNPSDKFVSKEFDDIYFSKEDGIAETKHVFLEGNQVQDRWTKNPEGEFNIGELGFGTGLNYFVSLDLWKSLAAVPNVTFLSLEKYPLDQEILRQMRESFPVIETWSESMLEEYEKKKTFYRSQADENLPECLCIESRHPSNERKFILKLYFGDITQTLNRFPAPIHCFYLDGFAPKKNPEMWTEAVFSQIRRISEPATTFATFTAAGFVKRNLHAMGFSVQKVRGFGRKREMLVGTFV